MAVIAFALPMHYAQASAFASNPLPAEQAAKRPPPKGGMNDKWAEVYGKDVRDLSGSPHSKPSGMPSTPPKEDTPRGRERNQSAVKVKNAPKGQDVKVRSHTCNNGIRQCAAAQTACTTVGGGHSTAPAQVTWVSVDDGPWQYATVSCGPPTSVEVPETNEGGAVEVELEAPPVPTLGQIQRAFRSLPFGKPGVKIQPKGQRTAKNLETFYAADWPEDDGLGPGDISKPIKLLSWTIEFKVAAQDYKYNFGDGKTSGWTASTGGTYPDGDITHTYSETGDVDVKVDARLTGQYRVNGGEWQDIDTVADLEDEPSFTLQVRGTKTGLVHR